MENDTKTTAIAPLDWETKLDTVRKTVAKDATKEEFEMFCSLARAYGLNPLAKEIWCVKMGGKTTIITARDGFLKIANSNANFEGMESDVVYAKDKFVKDKDGLHHMYTIQDRGPIVGAYAIVYRKDRRIPSYFFAPFKDYNKHNPTWSQYPHAMILKVAESMALKRAFSVSGLTSQEELGYEGDKQILPEQPQQKLSNTQQKSSSKDTKPDLHQLWHRYLNFYNKRADIAMQAMREVTGKENSSDYTEQDVRLLIEYIEHEENQHKENEEAIDVEVSEVNDEIPEDDFSELPITDEVLV